MATHSVISFEEYLEHIPDPDVEYVNGHRRERPEVAPIHGVMQSEIGCWLGLHRREWKLLSGFGVRTQVDTTAVLLPDVVVHPMRDWPLERFHSRYDNVEVSDWPFPQEKANYFAARL